MSYNSLRRADTVRNTFTPPKGLVVSQLATIQEQDHVVLVVNGLVGNSESIERGEQETGTRWEKTGRESFSVESEGPLRTEIFQRNLCLTARLCLSFGFSYFLYFLSALSTSYSSARM